MSCSSCVHYSGGDFRGYCVFCGKVSSSGHCSHYESRWEQNRRLKNEAGYSGGGCYLTTACVDYYGKADDCYELTTLRNFRDSYLASTEEGSAMIQEYYSIAPSIVDKLNSSSNKKEHYEYIYKEIQECIRAIENKEYTHTVNTYKKMVSHLQETL